MTVIAIKDGVAAADCSSWTGDIDVVSAAKLFRLPSGEIFAASGWKPVILKARQWLIDGADPARRPDAPLDKGDIDIAVLRLDGSLWYLTERFEFWQSDARIGTCGSHHEFLLGAMFAGASAEEAVTLAIKHCRNARGPVQVMRLGG